MSEKLSDLINEIGEWQAKQFPNATYEGAEAHWKKELAEAAEELADVVFLYLQMMRLKGVGLESRSLRVNDWGNHAAMFGINLERALLEKLAKNKARKWPQTPNAEGFYQHEEV